jgi:Haloacid dehalogenase-like hydrolase
MSRRARHRHDCERASGIGSLFAGKSALIFDFDGTIADTTLLHARAFEETLARLGVAVATLPSQD